MTTELSEIYQRLHDKIKKYELNNQLRKSANKTSLENLDIFMEQTPNPKSLRKSSIKGDRPLSRNSLNNLNIKKKVTFAENFIENAMIGQIQPENEKFWTSKSLSNNILEVINESDGKAITDYEIDSLTSKLNDIDNEALETLESAEEFRQEIVLTEKGLIERKRTGFLGTILSYLNPFNCVCKS